MNKIGIIGTRKKDSIIHLNKTRELLLTLLTDDTIIISGGCPKGGDRFANLLTKELGLTITIHYPDWNTYGKSAGFIRNTKIANDSDVLIAVVSDNRSGGTEDTIKKYLKDKNKLYLVY